MPRWMGRRRWCLCDLLTDGPGRCPGCGIVGQYRDSVERRVTDVPVVGHPLVLRVRVPRYRCLHSGCEREVFCHDSSRLARPGWSTTRRCARFVLRRLMLDRTTVAAVARELGRSWDTVNSIAVEATRALLLTDATRLADVRVIGVDEHRWAHTRGAAGQGYVTVIVDLTPVLDGSGPARLLDLVAGRSAAAMSSWLAAREPAFRERVEVVAMDGFGGYKTAATNALPDAVTVMDPFHVVALAGTKARQTHVSVRDGGLHGGVAGPDRILREVRHLQVQASVEEAPQVVGNRPRLLPLQEMTAPWCGCPVCDGPLTFHPRTRRGEHVVVRHQVPHRDLRCTPADRVTEGFVVEAHR
jgi:transposase